MRLRLVESASALLALLLSSVAAVAQQTTPFSGSSSSPVPIPVFPSAESAPPVTGNLSSLQGIMVSAIRIAGEGSDHAEWLEPLITQKINQPLDKHKVRESVQALYNTGRFAVIQVEAQQNPNGQITLIFDARTNFFFGSIIVDGAPSPPTANQLVSAGKLHLGERFSIEKVTAAMAGMSTILEENGYYQTKIHPIYDWDTKKQQVQVRFVITKGERAHVGQVNVTGTPGFPTEEVASTTGIKPGEHVSANNVTRALQRLRGKYQRHDRLAAQVALTDREYHPKSNTVDYTFDIVQGPAVKVRVEGAALHQGTIKKQVPIWQENAVDDDLLNEGSRNLRDYLQTQGYFDATVSYTEKTEAAQQQDITFEVSRGERHKVLEIELEGNKYFSRQTIKERMLIQPAGGLQLHGLFSQSLLTHDVAAIQSLYQANGFLQAKVEGHVTDDYRGHAGQIKVSITIQEGPQTVVGKLAIQGNSAVPDSLIRGLLSSTEGQPYSDSNVTADQGQITNYYFNHGFPEVRFESSATLEQDQPQRMDVTYKITEGPQIFVDQVLISGLRYTKGHVVNREISLKPGSPLDQEAMLDSQQRLYDLGIFNAVDMAVQNPDGDAAHKNVVFQVAEARRYTFTYGAGFEVSSGQPAGSTNPQGEPGAGGLVSFDATRLNFRGRDQTLTFQAKYGNLQKRVLVSYESPRWFDLPRFTFSLTAFYDDTFDISTFEAKRLEGSAELKERVDKATTFLYRLVYRRVSIPSGTLVVNPNQIPLFSLPVRVGLPDITYIRDTRDDPTDSHKGTFTTVDTGLASNIFGSQTNFGRILVQNSTYHPFYKKRWVLARSTRIGVEGIFGSTTFVPLPERFFAGGSNSDRGFGLNEAGPRDLDTGFPLGGEALFQNNIELRTPPLPLPFVGNDLSAVLFHDLGNVFDTPGDMFSNFLRYTQPNRAECQNTASPNCNFNYMSNAVGSGVRYRTPVGPVSFDLGYNLNPPTFPIASQNRFSTLGHWNFFFSIGQTF